MSIDLDKVILATPYNSYKNDGLLYTGTITSATSIAAGSNATATSSFIVAVAPVFSEFYAKYTEYMDLTVGGTAQWYDSSIASLNSVGVAVTAPAPRVGFLNAAIYTVISGTQVTVTFNIFNPYVDVITVTALTIPYAFIEYSIAN